MTVQDKIKIYNKLLAGLSKGVMIAAMLQEDGDPDELAKLEKRNAELADQAAKLRREIAKDWAGETEDLLASIGAANDRLQDRIRRIERDIAKAEDLVKALGHVDDLINIAKGVFL